MDTPIGNGLLSAHRPSCVYARRYLGRFLLKNSRGAASKRRFASLGPAAMRSRLADVLDRIVSGRTKVNALHESFPWAWKAAQGRLTALAAA
jgi:hypothetical protein